MEREDIGATSLIGTRDLILPADMAVDMMSRHLNIPSEGQHFSGFRLNWYWVSFNRGLAPGWEM